MSLLRKISVCQNATCQDKGSKSVLTVAERFYDEKMKQDYPELIIESGDCMGDCEQGPVVRVNDTIVMRKVDTDKIKQLLEDPEGTLGEVRHIQEQDRETFERIIGGELF